MQSQLRPVAYAGRILLPFESCIFMLICCLGLEMKGNRFRVGSSRLEQKNSATNIFRLPTESALGCKAAILIKIGIVSAITVILQSQAKYIFV